MAFTVVVLDDWAGVVRQLPCFALLAGVDVQVSRALLSGPEAVVQALRAADAVVLIRERTALTAEIIGHLPQLKVVVQTGRVGPHVDVEACERAGIAVLSGEGDPWAPAELTWALIMASRRRVVVEARSLAAGQWQTGLGQGLRGQTLGLWGFGRIASLVAGFARAFEMRVVAWGREGSRDRARAAGVEFAPDAETLFAQSDVVSLHLKLTPETRGIVTPALLNRMKPGALLVNTARAALIAPGALPEALRLGRPGTAALDVFEAEPTDITRDAWLAQPNVLATPHLGYFEAQSMERYCNTAFTQLMTWARARGLG